MRAELILAFIIPMLALSCSGNEKREPAAPADTPLEVAELTATTHPTAIATASPPPLPPVSDFLGPVVLYRKEEYPTVTFVAYDLGAKRALWSVPLSGDAIYGWASVGGRRLVVGARSKIALYSFDGSPMQELMRTKDETESYEWVAVSPDGETLAVVLHDFEPPGTPLPPGVSGPPARWVDNLVFYDLDAKRELHRVQSNVPEFEGFDGMFGPLMWLSDGSGVFMWGQTNSERPGDNATVYLDGRIQRHHLDGFAYVAPNAQVAVSGVGSLDCMFISSNGFVVRDLPSGRGLASIQNPSRAFNGVDWSPDSREFLFESRLWREDFECTDRWWAAEPLIFVLRLDTGVAEPVDSVESVYGRWYGEELTWLDCAGQFVPPRPHPFGNAIALSCREGQQQGTLYIHGLAVDIGQTFRLIGFIK